MDSSVEPAPCRETFGTRLRVHRRRWLVLATIAFVGGMVTGVWYWRRPDVWYRCGVEAIARGDLKRLQQAAGVLQGRAPGSARANLLLGAVALRDNNPSRALELLEAAVKEPETQTAAEILGGEALCRLQAYDSAIVILEQAVRRLPEHADAHRWLAVAYFDIGAMSQTITHLQRVAELDAVDPRPHRMIGQIYADAENHKQAVEAYQAALERSRAHPGVYEDELLFDLALSQLKLHRYADVLATLQGAPATPEFRILEAEVLYGQGNAAEARRIVEATPDRGNDPRALALEGIMALDARETQQAIDCLGRAVALRPYEFETRFKLARALTQAGKDERARVEFEEVERIKRIRFEFSNLLREAQKRPADADLRYRLGVLCEELRRPELARKWYRAALGVAPRHAPAQRALDKLSS
jgi:tetratricopeptide (TPR) repeat protein